MTNRMKQAETDPEREMHERHWDCYAAMKRWLMNRNQGKLLADYFAMCPYRTAAIYGAGDLGQLLYYELKDTKPVIKYFIDRTAQGRREEQKIPIILVEKILEQKAVDVIIVTPINDYKEVTDELIRLGVNTPTVSLRDVIYEL